MIDNVNDNVDFLNAKHKIEVNVEEIQSVDFYLTFEVIKNGTLLTFDKPINKDINLYIKPFYSENLPDKSSLIIHFMKEENVKLNIIFNDNMYQTFREEYVKEIKPVRKMYFMIYEYDKNRDKLVCKFNR